MEKLLFYIHGSSPVQRFAAEHLARRGISIAQEPGPEVTHVLLGVPSFDPAGQLKGGGTVSELLAHCGPDVTVIGGNLDGPAFQGQKVLDLLKNETYLCKNAAITADCALTIGAQALPVVLPGCPVLILGWGRIGKCLAQRLRALGADVAVAARKPGDRAMLKALGCRTEDPAALRHGLIRYRLIYNTVPAPVLGEEAVALCREDCVLVELASRPGIASNRVISARGLPGKDAPGSSGALIAETILSHLAEKEHAL